ncbi:MAG: MBG domain-containing protein, partial [Planctomycetota bacterium]
SKVYDGTTSSVGVPTITSGNLVNGDTAAWTQTFDTQNAGTGKTLTPAGTVNDGNGGKDYSVTFTSVGTGTITPKPLTVTADSQSIVYGAALPALTYTYSSLVSGDTAAIFTGSLATTAVASSSAGTYPITQGTLAATANYALTFVGATLTISKANAPVALSGLIWTYDGTPKSATATTTPAGLNVILTYNGSTTAPTLPGSYAVVAAINDPDYAGSTTGTLVIVLAAAATASASPNLDQVALAPSFSGSATGLAGALAYSWNFGDGSAAAAGQNVTHIYIVAGTYTAVLTVTDANGVSATASVNVTALPSPFPIDRDGDGYPDEMESAFNSDPNNKARTPFDLPPPVKGAFIAVNSLSIRLNFAQPVGHDSLTLTGFLPMSTTFSPAGQHLLLDVGGVCKAFMMDGRGHSSDGGGQLRIGLISHTVLPPLNSKIVGNWNARYSISLRNGTFAAALKDKGLVSSDNGKDIKGVALQVPVTVIVDGRSYQVLAGQIYKAKAGQWGQSR